MNTLENELIAKFIGVDCEFSADVYKDSKSSLRHKINNRSKFDDLLFDKSWDWLMPIIDIIESFGYKFQMCRKQVYILPDTGVYAEIIFSAKCESKIESAYQAVLWFIKNVNHDNN